MARGAHADAAQPRRGEGQHVLCEQQLNREEVMRWEGSDEGQRHGTCHVSLVNERIDDLQLIQDLGSADHHAQGPLLQTQALTE
jgi:hypothetical protein